MTQFPLTEPPATGLCYSFLGPHGTFTESALEQLPHGEHCQRVPAPSVLAALNMLDAGEVDGAVVPIENSVEGGVTATLDAVSGADGFTIQAETLVPITFVAAARERLEWNQVNSVATHSHAWAQVRRWAERQIPDAEYVAASSTAAAAHGLLADPQQSQVAICSPLVAEQLKLVNLAEGIEDNRGAMTRFVLITHQRALPEMTGADKTTVTVPLPEDRPGALMEILEHLSTRGVNICRIESRPTGTGMGQYFFSLDLEGHIAETRVADALAGIHRISPQLRFLGSYARADRKAQKVRGDVSAEAFDAAASWIKQIRGS